MILLIKIALILSAAFSFGYGCYRFIGKKAALFKLLITFSMGCFMLGRLNELITYIVTGSSVKIFNIGMLGIIGGFMFIFSASYGQMDGLVDDRKPNLMKYRLIALAAPAGIILTGSPILKSSIPDKSKIISFAVIIVIALASYFNLKHIIIPDVSFGIIESIRQYNMCSLALAFAYAAQFMADKTENELLWVISSALIILICPIIVPVMEGGSKKWTV